MLTFSRFGTYSTSEAINAGLDLEMPAPTTWRGAALEHAVLANKVKPHILDQRVRAVLDLVKAATKSGVPEDGAEGILNRPEDQQLLRQVAAESIVLLKNQNNVLPFDMTKPIVVIGPNAKAYAYSGGGSASLLPYYCISPFQGIQNACQDVRFSQGSYSHCQLPSIGESLRTSDGQIGFTFKVYDKPTTEPDRKLLDKLHLTDANMYLADYAVPNYRSITYYCDCEGLLTPEEDGKYDFGLTVSGTAKLFIDDELLVDNTHNQRPGTAYFGTATVEEIQSIDLVKGKTYKVTAKFGTAPTAEKMTQGTPPTGAGGIRIGMCKQRDPEQMIADAVEMAGSAEQVVVFTGLHKDWESEGFDRPHMDLPAYSDELVTRVIQANPYTVVCIQSGTPVTMPWINQARGVLQAWYGGDEMGNGIADVLFGSVNPVSSSPASRWSFMKANIHAVWQIALIISTTSRR